MGCKQNINYLKIGRSSRKNEKKENAKYETYILNFLDALDKYYEVFCPSHFLKQIRKNQGKNQRPNFVSRRMIQRGENKMASFEISYKKKNKSFDILE